MRKARDEEDGKRLREARKESPRYLLLILHHQTTLNIIIISVTVLVVDAPSFGACNFKLAITPRRSQSIGFSSTCIHALIPALAVWFARSLVCFDCAVFYDGLLADLCRHSTPHGSLVISPETAEKQHSEIVCAALPRSECKCKVFVHISFN